MRMRITLLLFLLSALLPGAIRAQTPQANPEFTTRLIQVEGKPVTLSPDGQWIAGIRDAETICIWDIVNLDPQCDDTGQTVNEMSLIWAPDSTAVALSTGSLMVNAAESDIFTFDTTGTLRNLTPNAEPVATPIASPPGISSDTIRVIDVYPVWSPDSASIAFARSTVHLRITGDASSDGITLMKMTRDGDDLQPVTALTADPLTVIAGPSFWLPDDSIIVSSIDAKLMLKVFRIDPAGKSEEMAIDPGPQFDSVSVNDVSPDGAQFSLSVYGVHSEEHALFDPSSGVRTVDDRLQEDAMLLILGPLGFSPSGDTVVYRAAGGPHFDPMVAIGLDDPLLIPLEGATNLQGGWRVLDWANNNTILASFEIASGDAALLVTLDGVSGAR